MGILPAGLYRNRSFAECYVNPQNTPIYLQNLLYDPQTSGGLLIAVDSGDAEALLEALEGKVPSAQRIGVLAPYEGGARIILQERRLHHGNSPDKA